METTTSTKQIGLIIIIMQIFLQIYGIEPATFQLQGVQTELTGHKWSVMDILKIVFLVLLQKKRTRVRNNEKQN